jgi:hypothetical protein
VIDGGQTPLFRRGDQMTGVAEASQPFDAALFFPIFVLVIREAPAKVPTSARDCVASRQPPRSASDSAASLFGWR